MNQSKIGRPLKLTDSVKIKLLTALSKGASYEPACHYAGIAYSTFRNWMLKGDTSDEHETTDIFSEFFIEIKKAESEAAVVH